MNKEEIIRMAREAGLWIALEGEAKTADENQLIHFAALVAASEREACVQIVELEASQYAEPVWAVEIVNDIRARGNK